MKDFRSLTLGLDFGLGLDLDLTGCILASTEGCFLSTNFKITQMKSLSDGLKEYEILTEHTDTID